MVLFFVIIFWSVSCVVDFFVVIFNIVVVVASHIVLWHGIRECVCVYGIKQFSLF